eukprot:353504-Chlamydomonas_euryale.AAC.1
MEALRDEQRPAPVCVTINCMALADTKDVYAVLHAAVEAALSQGASPEWKACCHTVHSHRVRRRTQKRASLTWQLPKASGDASAMVWSCARVGLLVCKALPAH